MAVSGVVARADQQICQLAQLILGEGSLVLGPVVLVRPLELLEDGLDGGWDGRRVVQMVGEGHEDGGQGGEGAEIL